MNDEIEAVFEKIERLGRDIDISFASTTIRMVYELVGLCKILAEQNARQNELERRELIRALVWMERATCQGHNAHWDPTGQGGAGCPACKRAHEQRERASEIVKRATGESIFSLAIKESVTEQ